MENINEDIRYLAETLEHRQSATEQEEQAADYVLERLKPYVDEAHKTGYGVVDNFRLVMAAYYGEFVVTCALAFWWPAVAFCYGFFIFIAYVAEFMGYPVFSRLFAYFESFSVVGFKEGENPDRLLVFTAYLDTDTNPVSDAAGLPLLRYVHQALMAGMVLILATCLVDAFGAYQGVANPFTWWIRTGGIAAFALTAGVVLLAAFGGDVSSGANHNASGIAALLEIAQRLHKRRIRKASILFYFSGGHHANMAGMRGLVREIIAARKETYIINLEGVGAGGLCYTESEGLLMATKCSKRLISAAAQRAGRYKARAARVHDFATAAYVPLIRGLNVISLIGLDKDNLPLNYGAEEDTRHHIDPAAILNAARFAESIGRTVVNGCETDEVAAEERAKTEEEREE
ncbi:MAG: Peptidase family M28 [Candidatus Hydrogenedentes bacterium ADurb.Bin101]|nr:MAG: Peptidase family M28 [Candidatus Hydrogenedentes bacterium ADurb.Bin101]